MRSSKEVLNKNNARALKIKISGSSPERKSIAKILYDIDALINPNNNTSTILEAMAEAIFESWFVDFDPVQAKQLAREAGLPAERAEMALIYLCLRSLSLTEEQLKGAVLPQTKLLKST